MEINRSLSSRDLTVTKKDFETLDKPTVTKDPTLVKVDKTPPLESTKQPVDLQSTRESLESLVEHTTVDLQSQDQSLKGLSLLKDSEVVVTPKTESKPLETPYEAPVLSTSAVIQYLKESSDELQPQFKGTPLAKPMEQIAKMEKELQVLQQKMTEALLKVNRSEYEEPKGSKLTLKPDPKLVQAFEASVDKLSQAQFELKQALAELLNKGDETPSLTMPQRQALEKWVDSRSRLVDLSDRQHMADNLSKIKLDTGVDFAKKFFDGNGLKADQLNLPLTGYLPPEAAFQADLNQKFPGLLKGQLAEFKTLQQSRSEKNWQPMEAALEKALPKVTALKQTQANLARLLHQQEQQLTTTTQSRSQQQLTAQIKQIKSLQASILVQQRELDGLIQQVGQKRADQIDQARIKPGSMDAWAKKTVKDLKDPKLQLVLEHLKITLLGSNTDAQLEALTHVKEHLQGLARPGKTNPALTLALQQVEATTQYLQRHELMIQRGNDAPFMDRLISSATNGEMKKASTELHPKVHKQMTAEVLDEVRKLANAHIGPVSAEQVENWFTISTLKLAGRLKELKAKQDRLVSDSQKVDTVAKAKLGDMYETFKSFSDQRMHVRLYSSAGNNYTFDDKLSRQMQAQLGDLDNTQFLKLYKKINSADLLELRLSLVTHPDNALSESMLTDLNNFEAMIQTELLERALQPAPITTGPRTLANPELETLAEAERNAAKKSLLKQSDAYLKGDELAPRKVDSKAEIKAAKYNVSVAELVELMKASDLTINLFSSTLFTSDAGMFDKQNNIQLDKVRLKNVHELGPKIKGPEYLARRGAIEHSQFPSLDRPDTRPEHNPISSALNPGERTVGAAFKGGYGLTVLVLKDEVKERSTFTPMDSFYAFEAHITDESIAKFKVAFEKRILTLPINEQEELRANDSAKLKQLYANLELAKGQSLGLGHAKKLEDFMYDDVVKDVISNKGTAMAYMLADAMDSFIDKSLQSNRVASYEHLEQLIGDLNDEVVAEMSKKIHDSKKVNLPINEYIEAQIFGGVDLTRDVKEIRVNFDELEGEPQMLKNAQKMAEALGVPLVVYGAKEKAQTRLDTDSTAYKPFPKLENHPPISYKKFKEDELPQILDVYKSHEQSFDSEGIHGRRHISRALIYSQVMANLFIDKGADIDTNALYRTLSFHDSGRESNGIDIYESQSGDLLVKHLKSQGIDDEEYLKLAKACIVHEAPDKSLEGGILKAADSLDIIRVRGEQGYDKDYFWFMHKDVKIGDDKYLEVDETLRDKLIKEAAKLIQATEPRVEGEDELDDLKGRVMELDEKGLERYAQLKKEVPAKHQERNRDLDSATLFKGIEDELLQHPEKYPTLFHYYTLRPQE